ncbi:MAG TPA: flagellar protein FlaG [Candidatus Latescibacteria bacterium]|nr:flagellar protein FlaG [Candidatus Latescibacterota bacterium]
MQTRGRRTSPHEGAQPPDLERIGEELNRYMRMFNTYLAFEIDRPSNRIIIKIIDTETKEVIRQIPPEEMLRIMHNIDELLGLLVDERV